MSGRMWELVVKNLKQPPGAGQKRRLFHVVPLSFLCAVILLCFIASGCGIQPPPDHAAGSAGGQTESFAENVGTREALFLEGSTEAGQDVLPEGSADTEATVFPEGDTGAEATVFPEEGTGAETTVTGLRP